MTLEQHVVCLPCNCCLFDVSRLAITKASSLILAVKYGLSDSPSNNTVTLNRCLHLRLRSVLISLNELEWRKPRG